MLQLAEHVLSHAPWSFTKLGTLEKCGLQYDYKYGTQKQPELVQFAESRVGVAVHKALEVALQGFPVAKAMELARGELELSTQECEDLDARVDQIEGFVKRMDVFKKKHGVTETCIEEKWGVYDDLTWSGFFGRERKPLFRGMVDFAMLTRSKDLIIIDHKSGKQRDLEHYTSQLKVYAVMGLARFPEARGVQCAINFVMPDQLVWGKFASAAKIREEYVPWMQEYLTTVCAELLKAPAPNKTKLCDWCGYRPICPAHKEVNRGQNSDP